ncbi:hypothetical protein KAR34_06600 [bacterium]|nr:hypothetical protein [bacterium]
MFNPSSIVSISAWHALRCRKWIKIIAVVIILTFLFPYITWAFQPGNFQINLRAIIFNQQSVIIPKKIGSVNHAHQGDERLVVHIQDLHCNYEVQKNIANLIHLLAEKHGLRLVSIEGASLPIDPSKIRTFPIATIREEVSDYFVRQGKLSGAEYYAATGKYPVLLEGIENAEHYARNKRSVEFILKDESQGYCHDLRDILAAVKPAVYNSRLLKFDQKSTAYGEGKTGVLQHCLFLRKIARKLNHKLSDYPNFTAYAKSKQKIFAPNIEVDELFAEIDCLDYAVREYLYTKPAQRRLDQHLRRVSIMEKLLNISVSPAELLEFRENRENFRVQAFIDFVRAQDSAGEFEIDPEIFALDDFLNATADFYSVADERGDYFVANTLAKMRQHNEKIAVLVTGGYHTQHVLSALHTEGLSILSIKPRITQQDLVNPYFSLLRNRKTPLEKLLSQEQKIFAPEPYLPSLSVPGKSSHAAAGSNNRKRLFARLLRLLFAAKTMAYRFFTKKSGKKLPAAIGQKLKKYWAQNSEFLPAEEEVTGYPNGVISFTVPPENNQELLAVVWPSKQAAPLEAKDALRIMNFEDVNIAIVSKDKLASVQAQLESTLLRQTALAWIMSTFDRLRNYTRAFGRRFRESVSILAAAIQHNPAVSFVFADIIFLLFLSSFFLDSALPSDIGWMTMALPFTNQLQAPDRFFPAWAPGLSPSADQILNKLDQPIPGHSKRVRWINKKRALQEIEAVPLIERTEERILSIVLRHIRWKGEPFLSAWEQAFILEKGIDSFLDRIGLWDFFRAKDIEAGYITGGLITNIFAANRPWERLPACLKLFKSPNKSQRITGTAAAELYNSSRTLEEMSLLIPTLFDTWSYQNIIKLVLKSRLDQHEIRKYFINEKTRIRTIKNSKECSQYIREILDNRQAGEKVKRDAGLIIQDLRKEGLLSPGKEEKIVARLKGAEVFSEKAMLRLILRNLKVRSDKSPALNQAGINLIAKQNNLKTLREKIGLLSKLYNMRDREGRLRLLEPPLFAAALANGRKNEDNITIIIEHLQELKTYALVVILRGGRLPEEAARIIRALSEAQFSDTAIRQVFELNAKERRIHILLPLVQQLLPGPIRQKQFISLLTYKTTPYEVLNLIQKQNLKWPDILSILDASLTQKQREEASLEYLAVLLAVQDESGGGPNYNECIQLLQTVLTSKSRKKLQEQLWTLYDYPLAESSQANLSVFAGLPKDFQKNLVDLLFQDYLTPTAYADFQETVAFNIRFADSLQRAGCEYAALAKEADPTWLSPKIFDRLTQNGHALEIVEHLMRRHDRFSPDNVDPKLCEIIESLAGGRWLDAQQFWRNISAEPWQQRTDDRIFQMALEHIQYESRTLFTDYEIEILVTKGFRSFHNKLKVWPIIREMGISYYINSFLISNLLLTNNTVDYIKKQLDFYKQYQMAGSTAGYIANSKRPVSEWEKWYPRLRSIWKDREYVAQLVLRSALPLKEISFHFIKPNTRVSAINNLQHFKEIMAKIKKAHAKRQLGIERKRLLTAVKNLQASKLIGKERAEELIVLCENVFARDLTCMSRDIVTSITRQGIQGFTDSCFYGYAERLSPRKLVQSLERLKFLYDFRFQDGTLLPRATIIRIIFSARTEGETRYLLWKYKNLKSWALLSALFGKRPITEVEALISRLDSLEIKPTNPAYIIPGKKNLHKCLRLINYVAKINKKSRGPVLRDVFKRFLTTVQLMDIIRANLGQGARLQREQLAELIREGMSEEEIQALRLYFRELLQRQAVMLALTTKAARPAAQYIDFRLMIRNIDTTTLFELIDLFLDQETFTKRGQLKQQILNQARADQALFRELKQDYANFRVENLIHTPTTVRQKLWTIVAQLNFSLDHHIQDRLDDLLYKWYDGYFKEKYYAGSHECGTTAANVFIRCRKKYNPYVSLLEGKNQFASLHTYMRAGLEKVYVQTKAPNGFVYYVLRDMERLETEKEEAGREVTEANINAKLILLGHSPYYVEKAREYLAENGAKKVEYNDKIQLNPLLFGIVVCCVLLTVYFFNGSVPSDFGWMTMALPFWGKLSLRQARERKTDTNPDVQKGLIPANIWTQLSVIKHKMYEFPGKGHRRASWEEVKTIFRTWFSSIGLGKAVEKAAQSSGIIFSDLLNKRMPNNYQSAMADWEVDSKLWKYDPVCYYAQLVETAPTLEIRNYLLWGAEAGNIQAFLLRQKPALLVAADFEIVAAMFNKGLLGPDCQMTVKSQAGIFVYHENEAIDIVKRNPDIYSGFTLKPISPDLDVTDEQFKKWFPGFIKNIMVFNSIKTDWKYPVQLGVLLGFPKTEVINYAQRVEWVEYIYQSLLDKALTPEERQLVLLYFQPLFDYREMHMRGSRGKGSRARKTKLRPKIAAVLDKHLPDLSQYEKNVFLNRTAVNVLGSFYMISDSEEGEVFRKKIAEIFKRSGMLTKVKELKERYPYKLAEHRWEILVKIKLELFSVGAKPLELRTVNLFQKQYFRLKPGEKYLLADRMRKIIEKYDIWLARGSFDPRANEYAIADFLALPENDMKIKKPPASRGDFPEMPEKDKWPPDSILNRSFHGSKPGMMKLFQFLFTPQLQLKAPFKVFRLFGGSVLGLLKIAGLIYISLPPARRPAKIIGARKLSWQERQIVLKDAADARRLNLDNFRVHPRSRKNMGLIRKIISGKWFGDCEVSPKGLINVYIPDRLFFVANENPLNRFLSDILVWTQVMKYRQAIGKLNSLASENITRSQLAEELFNSRSVTKVRASYINIKLSRQLDRESAEELLDELISALRAQYQDAKKLTAGAEKARAGYELALSLETFNDLMRLMPEFEARSVRSSGRKLLRGSNTIWFPSIGRTRWLGVYQDMLEYIGIVFDPGDLERKWQRFERNNNSAA